MSDSFTPVDTGGSSESVSDAGVSSDDIGALIDTIEGSDDASSASSPAAPADPPAAPTTAAPAAPAESAPPQPGPIPYDRHKEILENARKEREATEQALKAKFGWAEAYDPTHVAESVKLYQWLTTNPQGFRDFLDGQLRQQQPAKPADEPIEPLLKAEDGTAAYSADQVQKLLDKQAQQLWQKVEQEFGPIKTKEQRRELEAQSQRAAQDMVATMRTWPMFSEHEADVKALLATNATISPFNAYLQVLREKALPSVETKIRTQYEGTLANKAAAATTRPGPAPATPVNYREMDARDIAALTLDELEGVRR